MRALERAHRRRPRACGFRRFVSAAPCLAFPQTSATDAALRSPATQRHAAIRTLRRHGYPPDGQETAVQLGIDQSAALSNAWDGAASDKALQHGALIGASPLAASKEPPSAHAIERARVRRNGAKTA